MNRTGNGAALCEDPHDFLVMQNLYDAAVRQLTLKFNILNSEFNVLYARNPIHHIEGRVKSQESIVAKLEKKGLPVTIASALEKLPELKGCQAHSTVMLTEGDFKVFKKLGVELTNDPIYETK